MGSTWVLWSENTGTGTRVPASNENPDVSASSQINMAGFCPGYLNQYCKSASVKKDFNHRNNILSIVATFCFLKSQAVWCDDVN